MLTEVLVPLDNDPDVQPLTCPDKDLYNLPIHAHLHRQKSEILLPNHGWRSHLLRMLDLHRLHSDVHPRRSILEPEHPRTLHEQTRVLVCQCCIEHHNRSDDLRDPDAAIKAIAAAKTAEDWVDVRIWVWCFVSPGSLKLG